MSTCDEVAGVVGELEIGSIGALSRLDDLRDPEACIAEGLVSAVATEDWDAFERYLIAASRHPSSAMTAVLCDVLNRRLENINNEDIVDVLAAIADPTAVDALEDTILWQPPWDEFHSLAVKCVWALASIGTQEALEVIRGAAAVGPTEVREAAAEKLRIVDQ